METVETLFWFMSTCLFLLRQSRLGCADSDEFNLRGSWGVWEVDTRECIKLPNQDSWGVKSEHIAHYSMAYWSLFHIFHIAYIQIHTNATIATATIATIASKAQHSLHRCRAVRTALFQQQLHHLLGALMFHRLRPATCRDGSRNVKTWRLTFKVHFGCRTVH